VGAWQDSYAHMLTCGLTTFLGFATALNDGVKELGINLAF